MKTKLFTFTCFIAALSLSSCDHDGNTGNGANDPTSKFESDKVMKTGDDEASAATGSTQSTNDSTGSNSGAQKQMDSTGVKKAR